MSDELNDYRRRHMADLMSDISEDHYCAGWLVDNEFSLWEMVQGGDRHYGLGEVPEERIAVLRRLANETGVWCVWDDVTWRRFVPLAEWRAMFEEWKRKEDAARAAWAAKRAASEGGGG